MKWRPIETAPRDGTEILSIRWLNTHWWYAHVRWVGDGWQFCNDGDCGVANPTYWQRLPAPPKAVAHG